MNNDWPTEVSVIQIAGDVIVVDAQGNERVLEAGAEVMPGEMIITPADGHVQLDIGKSESEVLPAETAALIEIDPQSGEIILTLHNLEAESVDLASIQQAILEGQDPTEILEEAAAGSTEPLSTGSSSFISVDQIEIETEIVAGFDASIDNSEPEFASPDEEESGSLFSLIGALTAGDDSLTVDEDSGATPGSVSGNDSTISGGVLSYALATDVANGTLVFNPDGSYTYAPDANYNGADSFTYTVSDAASGESLTQSVSLTVNPVTDLSAGDDSASGAEDTTISSSVAGNDSTLSGGTLSYALTTDVTHGTLLFSSNGSYTYTPDANYNGADSFTYTVTDADSGESLTQSVNITVDPVTDLSAGDDSLTVNEDSSATTASVSGNDSTISGGTLSYALTTDVSNGTLVFSSNGSYTYTPDANYNGADSFTYTVTDADSDESLTQTVNITVNPLTDLTADDDSASGDEDTTISASVAGNDSTLSGGTLSYAVATDVTHGTLVFSSNGSYTYTPDANYNGADSFTYTVTDAASGESLTQSVNITVNPVTDLSAGDDSLTVSEDSSTNAGTVSGNDSTLSGGTLSYAVATDVTHGTLVFSSNGSYSYTPNANYNGADSFTYTVTDADSGESLTQSVNITVDPVTDLSAGDDSLTVNEDSSATTASVSGNDSTLSGGTLSYAVTTDVSHGTLAFSSNGSYSYTPDANYNGADSFTYTVTDAASGESLTQTVTITVTAVNDAATVSSATESLSETDAPLTASGTLTATDVDNPDNTFTANSIAGTIGSFSIDAAGAWSFTANSAFDSLNVGDSVNETFNLTSVDGTPSTVQITINGTNDAPDAIILTGGSVTENAAAGTVVGTLTATDPDGPEPFTFSLANDPSGLFEIVGNEILVKAGADIDFETAESHQVMVEVADSAGETYSQIHTLTVVDSAPTLSVSLGSAVFTAATQPMVSDIFIDNASFEENRPPEGRFGYGTPNVWSSIGSGRLGSFNPVEETSFSGQTLDGDIVVWLNQGAVITQTLDETLREGGVYTLQADLLERTDRNWRAQLRDSPLCRRQPGGDGGSDGSGDG